MTTLSIALLALLPKLVGPTLSAEGHPVERRAKDAAVAVEAALAAEGLEGEALSTWARRLWGWSYWESSWLVDPPGSNDAGHACGILQVHRPEQWLPGATCAAVRKDAVLGYRAGYRMLRHLVSTCGSVDAALGAYATGQCRTKMMLVRYRCARLGDRC